MKTKGSISWRIIGTAIWLVTIPAIALLALNPIGTRSSRLAMALAILVFLIGSFVLSRRKKPVFYCLIALFLASLVFLVLPGRRVVSEHLRDRYIAELISHEGIPYVWGGESRRGIDCSGLPRRSLQNALMREGLLTLNPAMIRMALDLWWNDTTAMNIGEGYSGRTHRITECRSLNTLDHSLLKPGDLAVTASGGHMLVYLGDNQWIEADPLDLRVLRFTVPEPKNAWFFSPMKIVRWTVFGD